MLYNDRCAVPAGCCRSGSGQLCNMHCNVLCNVLCHALHVATLITTPPLCHGQARVAAGRRPQPVSQLGRPAWARRRAAAAAPRQQQLRPAPAKPGGGGGPSYELPLLRASPGCPSWRPRAGPCPAASRRLNPTEAAASACPSAPPQHITVAYNAHCRWQAH